MTEETSNTETRLSVDLKFSLWSEDRVYWDERAPGVWDQMANLPVGATLEVNTAPWKEIRFGTVTISRYNEGWFARGLFWAEFDEDPRIDVEVSEDEPDFEALMAAIDRRESDLIEAERSV